jgi:hypothetical protein
LSEPVASAQELPVATAATTPEHVLKAAYLYNFALFVEWPPEAFTAIDSPIVIGVIGSDPFNSALNLAVGDKHVGGRAVIVRQLQWDQDLTGCHILFVSSSEASRTGELATRLDKLPVLVVGETPGFARRGGTLNFTKEGQKVGFEVNLTAARRARLTISSSLLNLATIVRGG